MSKIDFTVAIPTYNGANRLPKLLDKLRSQINTEHLAWQILVVDNNSTDNTAKIIQDDQANWKNAILLKYTFEPQQGAAFARVRAIQEADSELVGFLDDDIIPNSDWVTAAYNFAKEHPQAGAWGGQIHGEFEVPPPENFKRIQSFLAIRERGNQAHLYDPENLLLPPSAAWVVRRKAWLDSVTNPPTLAGRVNGSMLGGEDFELLMYMHKVGWEIWYNPVMHSYHQIPAKRLERDYLMALSRGCGLCICHLRMINANPGQIPIIFAKIMLGGLKRYLGHLLKYRGQVKTDLVAACEKEFYWASFVSPFYFLSNSIKTRVVNGEIV
ncbi:hormogonium polysaccharide biosynthesis glycosyltransferase HpsE [Limnofasciculus baicalensis]|uniref:Hormogonium polysaccharide biosynthesis glycosyltransferase HpsE n=1 Tax=Limnofasciculus baicalensis BBK-W-15 TaxID=2699891 RepID=A0AAE3GUP8_9CYAN|nr:hormogonium polysaccharide biosynthesis glycosyltransferase HpsE [Limnofasciculus baicalensis]MCP2730223.1 hormogonium polysaccharide biosynthesis glycosyltransferase HpsE [Limnofasciculus baicalensis BBK-W-15]